MLVLALMGRRTSKLELVFFRRRCFNYSIKHLQNL